jgi:hypothetical protein
LWFVQDAKAKALAYLEAKATATIHLAIETTGAHTEPVIRRFATWYPSPGGSLKVSAFSYLRDWQMRKVFMTNGLSLKY